MNHPHSFIICNISIDYPKRRIFDIFQQKKICIIESIEFVLSEDNNCYAIVYIANWYYGKVCIHFIENLMEKNYVELIDCNHHVWKIVSTPTIIKNKPKWFQSKSAVHTESNDVVVKIKSKPIHVLSDKSYEDTNNTEIIEDHQEDSDHFGDSESEYADFELLLGK